MKTPKRQYEEWEAYLLKDRPRLNEKRIKLSRWKRKNREAQYKRTIARLTDELWRERERSMYLHAAYCRLAQIDRSAKQNTSICTDAEQLTERKEQA